MPRRLKIGSRKSVLALIQTNYVADMIKSSHPEIQIDIVAMDTTGDKILDKPLDAIGGKGLFTLELEQSLRNGEIDLSVHSLKDMPTEIPDDLPILAYSKREDPMDALVLPKGCRYSGLSNLKTGKPVGCSSSRRTVQLLAMEPELTVSPVRGNVPTRIEKLDAGEYGALILAAAGLRRLNLIGRASGIFTADEMIPAAGQGILAIQGRKDFDKNILDGVENKESRIAAVTERAVISCFGCGCTSPAAAFCQVSGDEMELSALFKDEVAGGCASGKIGGSVKDSLKLAQKLSQRLMAEAKHAI